MKRAILCLTTVPLILSFFLATPAEAKPVNSQCPEDNPNEFIYAETHNFDIFICGSKFPQIYVGRAKNGSTEITIPLLRTKKRNTFIALNEDYPDIYRYVLTPHQLTVIKNGRTIFKETAKWRTR
jgi:hypothetical protein